jgi:hypothetical protein
MREVNLRQMLIEIRNLLIGKKNVEILRNAETVGAQTFIETSKCSLQGKAHNIVLLS